MKITETETCREKVVIGNIHKVCFKDRSQSIFFRDFEILVARLVDDLHASDMSLITRTPIVGGSLTSLWYPYQPACAAVHYDRNQYCFPCRNPKPHADGEGSDQTSWECRFVWDFAGCYCYTAGFLVKWLICCRSSHIFTCCQHLPPSSDVVSEKNVRLVSRMSVFCYMTVFYPNL